MTNRDMLQEVDYLREKADVSYEEAVRLLERHNGNVMQALVELERQGRLFSQGPYDGAAERETWANGANESCHVRNKASSFFRKAQRTRVIIERRRENGVKETVLNLSALLVAGVTFFAPYITLVPAAIGFFTGYEARLEKPKDYI